MAEKEKRRMAGLAFLALGLAIAVLSAAYWLMTGPGSRQWAITGCVAGVIMALAGAAGALVKRRAGDERTVKLGAYAASWSWLSAVIVTSVLYLLNFYGIVEADAPQALGLVLLTLLGTAVAFNAYYRLRGDV